jgi:hypothetical protein
MTKLVIPKRIEEVKQIEEIQIIGDLYFRWITDALLPTDDFLLIEHMDKLKQMKAREDLYMRQLNWKVDQMNLKSTKHNTDT